MFTIGEKSPSKINHKKRKKKICSQVVSFDDDAQRPSSEAPSPDYFSAPSTTLSSPVAASSASPYLSSLERMHLEKIAAGEGGLPTDTVSKATVMSKSLDHKKASRISPSSSIEEDLASTAAYEQALEDLLSDCNSLDLDNKKSRMRNLTDKDSVSCFSEQSNLSGDSFCTAK